jgi:hypothetical protein
MLDDGRTYYEGKPSAFQRIWIMRILALVVTGILYKAVQDAQSPGIAPILSIFVLAAWSSVTVLLFIPQAKNLFLTPLRERLSTPESSAGAMRKEMLSAAFMIGVFLLNVGLALYAEPRFLIISCVILGVLFLEWTQGLTNRPTRLFEASPIIALGMVIIILAAFVLRTQQLAVVNRTFTGDQVFSTYAHQTVARGDGPFKDFIILHPPLSYMVGGLAIRLGSALNVNPVIAVRAMHILFYVASIGALYFLGKNMSGETSVGILAVMIGVWPIVLGPMSVNGSEKFVMLLPMLLGMLFAQERRWVLSGFFVTLGALSWAAGFIFVAAILGTAFLQQEDSRWIALGKTVAGILTANLLMAIYLLVKGTFRLFWQQFVVTTSSIVASELGFHTALNTYDRYGDAVSPRFLQRVGELKISEWFIVIFGVMAAVLCLSILVRAFIKKELRSAQLAILLGTVVVLVAAAFDFQAAGDFLPLIPFLSLFCAWGIWYIFASRSRFGWLIMGGCLAALLLVRSSVYHYRTMDEISSVPLLDRQQIASEWLNMRLAPDAPIQGFQQSLWPIILANRPNATRYVNPRPGSLMAMQSEGITLAEMLAELQDARPELVLSARVVDEEEFDTLAPIQDWLDEEYLNYGKVDYFWYASPDSPINMVVLRGMDYAMSHPEILQASMIAEKEGVSDEVVALLEGAADRGQSIAWVFLGHLYRDSGDREAARNAYRQALRHMDSNIWAQIALANLDGEEIVDLWGTDLIGQAPAEAHLLLPTRLARQARYSLEPVFEGYYLFDYQVTADGLSLTWWNDDGISAQDRLVLQWYEGDQVLESKLLYVRWPTGHPVQLGYPTPPSASADGFRLCQPEIGCTPVFEFELSGE